MATAKYTCFLSLFRLVLGVVKFPTITHGLMIPSCMDGLTLLERSIVWKASE
jgi:hypothetical protein